MEFPSSVRRKHIYKMGDVALLGQTFRGYFELSYIRPQRVGYPFPSDISINYMLMDLMVKSDGIRIINIIQISSNSPYIPMISPFFWGTSKSPGSIGQKLMAIWAPNLQRLGGGVGIAFRPGPVG